MGTFLNQIHYHLTTMRLITPAKHAVQLQKSHLRNQRFGSTRSISYNKSNTMIKLLSNHSLGELLPYSCFDPATQLFINNASTGFVIETLPLVGCGDDIPRQLSGIFQHTMPLGSNLQCLLIASPRVGASLKKWEDMRCGRSDVL